MTKPNYSHCRACKKKRSNSDPITLLNGEFIHKGCYVKISNKINDFNRELDIIEFQCFQLEDSLNLSGRFLGRIKSFFSSKPKLNVEVIQSQIKEYKKRAAEIKHSIEKREVFFKKLYDFWPSYPPDWEERKRIIQKRANDVCESCGKGYGEKQIHHKFPISKGGNHLISNLEYICVECHSDLHGGRDVSTEGKVVYYDATSSFQKKIDLINNAKDNGKIINFSYQKFNEDRSVRAISPDGLKQVGKSLCVYGYCYLRGEDRTFAIKRMRRLRITDSPGNCYDK